MGSRERILESLEAEAGGLCDDCLSRAAEVAPRQQVNQICRALASGGVLERERGICQGCKSSKLTNRLSRVFAVTGAPKLAEASIDRRMSVVPNDPAERLDKIRRRIIGMLGQVEHVSVGHRRLSERISEMREAGAVPSSVACMMQTLNSLRNVVVYERFVPGRNEEAVITGAWAAVEEWWGKR